MKIRDVRWLGPSLNSKKKRVYRPGGSRLHFQVTAKSLVLSRMKLSPALLNSKLSKGTWRKRNVLNICFNMPLYRRLPIQPLCWNVSAIKHNKSVRNYSSLLQCGLFLASMRKAMIDFQYAL